MKIRLICEFVKPLRLKIEKVYPENNTVNVIAGTAFRFNAKIVSGTIEEFSNHIGKEGIIHTDGSVSMTPDLLEPAGIKPFQEALYSLFNNGNILICKDLIFGLSVWTGSEFVPITEASIEEYENATRIITNNSMEFPWWSEWNAVREKLKVPS